MSGVAAAALTVTDLALAAAATKSMDMVVRFP